MSTLTKRDVQRLQRMHKAFEEKYEEEMRRGLVGGMGLRPEQYMALKERDSAHRIYRTAKQKFKQSLKGADEEFALPALHVTHIESETFEGWMEEVRVEETQRLREARVNAAKRKNILQQEGLLRRSAAKTRHWIVDHFISRCDSAMDVGRGFEEEMLTQDLHRELLKSGAQQANKDAATERLLKELGMLEVEVKKRVISEEKKTRSLFLVALRWARERRERDRDRGRGRDSVRGDSRVRDGGLAPKDIGAEGEVRSDVGADTANTGETNASTRASGAASAGEKEGKEEGIDGVNEEKDGGKGEEGGEEKEREIEEKGKEKEEEGEEAPSLPKDDLFLFLDTALAALAEEAVLLSRGERRQRREKKELGRQKRRDTLKVRKRRVNGVYKWGDCL
ncbi:hypothetical protein B484DRAFT_458664 [Ochromonadaceae sp. CCMP2298]|nr:hypothetical protein B484DRAFT_458664 [Ochromonadaceae sp. CCMP2298]